jgi:hypothetical protein
MDGKPSRIEKGMPHRFTRASGEKKAYRPVWKKGSRQDAKVAKKEPGRPGSKAIEIEAGIRDVELERGHDRRTLKRKAGLWGWLPGMKPTRGVGRRGARRAL